jgi:ABC-type multidrug transport system fused ATPase/permease subunit
MEHGSITETGSHRELMRKKGKYWEMYRKQSGRFES